MKKINLLLWLFLLALNAHAQPFVGANRVQKLRYYYLNPQYTADGVNTNRIWIMAHRGVWDSESPESSIQAIKNAVNQDYEILELDLRFSAAYNIVNGVQTAAANGVNREIIFQHDKSHNRAIYDNNLNWKIIPGLYKYASSQTFPSNTMTTSAKCGNIKFVMLDKLVPYRADGVGCIDGVNGSNPILLKLDGTESSYRMMHFPKDARRITNNDFKDFYDAVKNNILLNFDKLKDPIDFQDSYDMVEINGLLGQTIFKAKGVTGWWTVNVKLFGNKSITDKSVRNLSNTMYTPIFTIYDWITENRDGSITQNLTSAQKYARAKDSVDALFKADTEGRIEFAGCEIVYETTDVNDVNYGWLPKLADYVKNTLKKRVIQFSTVSESRQGAWSGNGLFWTKLAGVNVNYWEWLYANNSAAMKKIRADVFVGDKPNEFRGYLNSLGYNQKPIQ